MQQADKVFPISSGCIALHSNALVLLLFFLLLHLCGLFFIKHHCHSRNLTLCMLGNFSCFYCLLLTSIKIGFSRNSFRNTIRVANSLDQDQVPHSIGPDLGLNCLQRVSADGKSPLAKKELKIGMYHHSIRPLIKNV